MLQYGPGRSFYECLGATVSAAQPGHWILKPRQCGENVDIYSNMDMIWDIYGDIDLYECGYNNDINHP